MENCRDTNITQNNDTNKVVTEDTTKDIVNVFDFDGTIYDGESLIDCFFFYL